MSALKQTCSASRFATQRGCRSGNTGERHASVRRESAQSPAPSNPSLGGGAGIFNQAATDALALEEPSRESATGAGNPRRAHGELTRAETGSCSALGPMSRALEVGPTFEALTTPGLSTGSAFVVAVVFWSLAFVLALNVVRVFAE